MTDPQIIAAVLSAQKTSEATLQAANWTAWATIIASFIGAIGIVIAAWFAFKSGLKTQQHNNILEAKREVYLEAIARYQQIINNLKLISVIPNSFLELFLSDRKDFFIAIYKVQLICNTENKTIVDDFKDIFDERTKSLILYINSFIDSDKAKEEILEKQSYIEKELHKFELNNPQLMNYVPINDPSGQIHFELRDQLSKKRVELENAKTGNEFNLEVAQEAIKELIDALSVKYTIFSESLRKELKDE